MAYKIANFIVSHRFSLLFLCIILVYAAGFGIHRLKISANYEVYFDQDNPYLLALEEIDNTYSPTDNIAFVLTPKFPYKDVMNSHVLSAVLALTEKAWQLQYSKRVDSITNFQNSLADGDDITIENLVEDVSVLTAEKLQTIKDIAINEPALLGKLINQDATVTAVNVTFQLPGKNDATEVPSTVEAAKKLQSWFRKSYPAIDVRLVGVLVSNSAFTTVVKSDLFTLIPLSLLMVILTVSFFARSFSGVISTVLVILTSIIVAVGTAGWLNMKVTSPFMIAPSMIMTLSVADCLHLLFNYFYFLQRVDSKFAAMRESIAMNLNPVILTSLTTAVGFFSLNYSDSPPFRDLGNIVAIGVLTAMLFSLVLLPSLVLILPTKKITLTKDHSAVTTAISKFVIKYDKILLVSIASMSLLSCVFIAKNELNDVFQEYFSKRLTIRQDLEYTTQHLVGINRILYSMSSGKPRGINDPEYLQHLDNFVAWFKQQPKVLHVSSYLDVIKKLNKNMHGDDPSYYRIPDSRDLAAQYLLIYSTSLPLGLELSNLISFDESATKVDIELDKISSAETLQLERRATDWMQANLPKEMQSVGSSSHILFSHIGQMNIRNMLKSVIVALVLISLMLIIALRSVKYGLISLIPNMLPGAIAFGIWGLFVGQVGLSLSIIASMSIGIIVDYAIHFLTKYLKAKRIDHMRTQEAIYYSFHTVGYPILVTTIVLISGFLVLILSPFKPNVDMGIMTTLTIGIALIIDFFFLPALLLMWDKRKNNARKGHNAVMH